MRISASLVARICIAQPDAPCSARVEIGQDRRSDMASRFPVLGIAHFTCIDLPPAAFARLAGRVGYGHVGLRLHPAFPGAPSYDVPAGSREARDLAAILD